MVKEMGKEEKKQKNNYIYRKLDHQIGRYKDIHTMATKVRAMTCQAELSCGETGQDNHGRGLDQGQIKKIYTLKSVSLYKLLAKM